MKFEGTNLIVLLLAVNATGGMIFGYNTGIIGTALPSIEKALGSGFENSPTQQGVLTVSILVGAMIASAFGGVVANILGRRYATILLGVLTVIGALGSAVTPWLWVIVLFREVLGLGVGFSSAVCPVYVSEMAPAEKKGMLGASFQMSVTAGIVLAYLIGTGLSNVKYDWQWMFGIGAIPGVAMIAIGFIMPESYRMAKSQDLSEGGSTEEEGVAAYRLLVGPYLKELGIGLLLAATLQLTGINAIIYFAPNIFESAGLSDDGASLLAGLGVSGWNFLTTFGALFLVDKVGRRPLLLGGLAIMLISDVVLVFLFWLWTDNIGGIISIIFVFSFVGAFEFGIGSLFWPLLTEIYPPEVRSAGATIMNMVQWLFNVLLSMFFLPLQDWLGQSVIFVFFSLVGVVTFSSLFFLLPETKQGSSYGPI